MLSLGGLVWLVKSLVFSIGVKPCWAGVVFGRATVSSSGVLWRC